MPADAILVSVDVTSLKHNTRRGDKHGMVRLAYKSSSQSAKREGESAKREIECESEREARELRGLLPPNRKGEANDF